MFTHTCEELADILHNKFIKQIHEILGVDIVEHNNKVFISSISWASLFIKPNPPS